MESIGLFRLPDRIIALSGRQALDLGNFAIDSLFRSDSPRELLATALKGAAETTIPDPDEATLLPPIGSQEIWAAGVTYFRSRSARMEEAEQAGGDVFYDLVYEAERPEIFFKSTASRCRGHGDGVGIREDSTWDVPEPELTLAINRAGNIFGYTIGNDMSSRSIEGENPLYLPQAKVYQASCAIGPALWISEPPAPETRITLRILRNGTPAFEGQTQLDQMKRQLDELADWLFRHNEFPDGACLMTGTGIVPDSDFTLDPGDETRIAIEGLGELRNPIIRV